MKKVNSCIQYYDVVKILKLKGRISLPLFNVWIVLNYTEKMYLLWFEKQKSLSSKVPSGNNVHTTYENLQNLPNEGKTTKRQFDSTNASVCADAKESPANSIEEAPIDCTFSLFILCPPQYPQQRFLTMVTVCKALDDEVFYPPDDMSDVDIDDFVKDAVVTGNKKRLRFLL